MFEKKFFPPQTPFWLVASDEAGRGPLAGPVVAAAAAMKVTCVDEARRTLLKLKRLGVNDSKVLSAPKREALLAKLAWQHGGAPLSCQSIGEEILACWSECDAAEIDQINILQASLKAMHAAARPVSVSENLPVVWLIDGNRAPREVDPAWHVHPVVDGDAKSVLIGLASVIAKDVRDRLMQHYHELYPAYGFGDHMGYPTAHHRAAIAKYGPTPIHRQTFRGVREHISGQAT